MSQLGSRLIQAAQEATAMARGETVPGALFYAVPTKPPADAPGRRRPPVSKRAVAVEDTDGEPA